MSLFDDPEWGSSEVFTYYPSPENEVSFSADNIQENARNKRKRSKNRESAKKIKLSDEGKSEKYNTKSGKPHNMKTADKIEPADNISKKLNQKDSKKKKKKNGDINKKPQNEVNMSKQNSDNPAEKLESTTEQEKTQSLPVKKKKKKKVSNKRNKYKELHIQQMKKKGIIVADGVTGETPKNMKNDVGLLENGPPMRSEPCENSSRDQIKAKIISSDTSQTHDDICKMETTESKDVNEKIPQKSAKNKKSKKIKPKTDSAASLKGPVKIKSVGVNGICEINKNSPDVTDRSNSDKAGKKKKKKGHLEAHSLDSAPIVQNCTGKTSQNSEVCEKKGKKGKEKATKENNIGKKKKTNKDSQDKGLSKECKEEVNTNIKKQKKKKDKNHVDKGKKEDEEEEVEFEAKEFEGDDADSNLEHDLETYLKELNFDRLTHNKGDDDDVSSEDMELHSDEDWESDSSINDEESAKECTKQNDSSKKVKATNKENKQTKKGSTLKPYDKSSSIPNQAEDGLKNLVSPSKGKKFDVSILSKMLKDTDNKKEADVKAESKPEVNTAQALKQKMMDQLNAARFRFVNEQMYSSTSKDAQKMFKADPKSFDSYHKGFQSQVAQWPINPVDLIIKWLKNKPKKWVVADFGCGEAILAEKVSQETVHSFDLAAANSRVTVCDMAHTPLPSESVDVVVFCLSLMGTNIKDFILEANRVLHEGGIMKIAEVESRFTDVDYFINHVKKFGFHCTYKDTTMKYFYMFDFKKHRSLKNKKDFPDIMLKPCKYKKR